jgi:hypothetical protein
MILSKLRPFSTVTVLGYDFGLMSTNICTCEKCSGHRVTDPETGLLVQGRIVGRKEFLEHGRLERIKQRLLDATDVSCQLGSRSPNLSTIRQLEEESGPIPPVRGTTRRLPPEGTDHQFLRYRQHCGSQPANFLKPIRTQLGKCSQNFLAGEWPITHYPLGDWSSLLHPLVVHRRDRLPQKI